MLSFALQSEFSSSKAQTPKAPEFLLLVSLVDEFSVFSPTVNTNIWETVGNWDLVLLSFIWA